MKKNSWIAVLILITDQTAKALFKNLAPLQPLVVKNLGLPFVGYELPGFYLILVLFILLVGFIWFWRKFLFASFLGRVGLFFIIGGAVSNLIDRVAFGYVVDYINIGRPVTFNLADVGIFIGMILMLIVVLKHRAQKVL